MKYQAFFDGPHNYADESRFFHVGSSPVLVKELIHAIEAEKYNIEEITIAWYLYNNLYLHHYLKNLSKSGIRVHVITIPLEGYDNSKPKELTHSITNERSNTAFTKYDLARTIFKEMYRDTDHPNYKIHFFSHLYIRSRSIKKFARGQFPYSLHIKSAYIRKKNGFILALSSSNLAVRDLVKHESMLVIHDDPNFESSIRFFDHLVRHSIPIKDYCQANVTSSNSFSFIAPKPTDSYYFTAPFYFDSSKTLSQQLTNIISRAKERIIVSGQHLSAYNYKYDTRFHSKKETTGRQEGIFAEVIKRGHANVTITCLSQTYAGLDGGTGFRRPANAHNFKGLVRVLRQLPKIDYYVNPNIHSKFIVVDHILIYCTYNFTPTQFIFLDNVQIASFSEMPDVSYQGVHCEVAGHVVVENPEILELFLTNIALIKNDAKTLKVL